MTETIRVGAQFECTIDFTPELFIKLMKNQFTQKDLSQLLQDGRIDFSNGDQNYTSGWSIVNAVDELERTNPVLLEKLDNEYCLDYGSLYDRELPELPIKKGWSTNERTV